MVTSSTCYYSTCQTDERAADYDCHEELAKDALPAVVDLHFCYEGSADGLGLLGSLGR